MATRSNVYAVRVTESVYPWLVLGQYFVADTDGVSVSDAGGVKRNNEPVSAVGVDATIPIWGGAYAYAEVAELIKYGRGSSVGIQWAQNIIFIDAGFNAEYRVLDKSFIPGYFGHDYEINPVNIASAAATADNKNGYLLQFRGGLLDIVRLNAVYEKYNNTDPSLYAEGLVKITRQIYASAYFSQPNFSSFRALTIEEGAVQGGTLSYLINPFTALKTHYKKQYEASLGRVVETQYYEIELLF
jgi:hypothetical protein